MPSFYSFIIATVFKAALIIGTLSLISCKALITPNSTTELYNLRPGNYSVDKSHTRVLFKLDHLGLSTYVGRFNDQRVCILAHFTQIVCTPHIPNMHIFCATNGITQNIFRLNGTAIRQRYWLSSYK